MAAGRPKGAKNKRPVGEEYVKKAAQHRAAARLARVVPFRRRFDIQLSDRAAPGMTKAKRVLCGPTVSTAFRTQPKRGIEQSMRRVVVIKKFLTL